MCPVVGIEKLTVSKLLQNVSCRWHCKLTHNNTHIKIPDLAVILLHLQGHPQSNITRSVSGAFFTHFAGHRRFNHFCFISACLHLETWIIYTAVQMRLFWVFTTCRFVSWQRRFGVTWSLRFYCLRDCLHLFHSAINTDSVCSSETSVSHYNSK